MVKYTAVAGTHELSLPPCALPPFTTIFTLQLTPSPESDQEMVKYTAVAGTHELRSAICADMLKRKGLKYTPAQVRHENYFRFLTTLIGSS